MRESSSPDVSFKHWPDVTVPPIMATPEVPLYALGVPHFYGSARVGQPGPSSNTVSNNNAIGSGFDYMAYAMNEATTFRGGGGGLDPSNLDLPLGQDLHDFFADLPDDPNLMSLFLPALGA